jgi:hypothetical protein
MSVVSRGVVQAAFIEEEECQAHSHTLEVLHQWQELQGAVQDIASPERRSSVRASEWPASGEND